VTVLNASTNLVVATIREPGLVLPPAFDPPNGAFYYPSESVDGLSIVSGTTDAVVANVSLGAPGNTFLGDPTFDPLNGEVYAPAQPAGSSTPFDFVIGNGSASPPTPSGPRWAEIGFGVAGALIVAAALVYLIRRRRSGTPGLRNT
jgi:hypothetical protein